MNELLTAKEVATLLKVKPNQIYRLKNEAGLPFRKVGGAVRFFKEEVIEWVNSQK